MHTRALWVLSAACCTAWNVATLAAAQRLDPAEPAVINAGPQLKSTPSDNRAANVLSPDEWMHVDESVDMGLSWLASRQRPDGSFSSIDLGQPGVTGLCVLAFMAHGHVPGDGRYGTQLSRAIDYIASAQRSSGLIAVVGPDDRQRLRRVSHEVGVAAAYNHAISSLVLSESYGMSDAARTVKSRRAIDGALAITLQMQRWPKDRAIDRGGWRYLHDYDDRDSDLSITGWHLMFLRSARNSGFEVPTEPIDSAVAYIRRCYSQQYDTFEYVAGDRDGRDARTRAMAGAGVLALAHAGFHDSPEAQRAGAFILKHKLARYNSQVQAWDHDRYHYSLFNCTQGMYQLGGRNWEAFFPIVVRTVLDNQQSDGSWPAESHHYDGQFGNAYTTALALLALGAPNQLLPIFQR
jgi:hypothetical protein